MANTLELGSERVGNLIDFNPNTPEIEVVLKHSERGIEITVPWSDWNSPYALWFLSDLNVPQVPVNFSLPKRVLFQDHKGSVLLIGCRQGPYHTIPNGMGSGTLFARAAIIGVDKDVEFDRPQGLQVDVSGLRAWLGKTSWVQDEDPVGGVTLRTQKVPEIPIGTYDDTQLSLRFGRKIECRDRGDRIVLSTYARCVSRSNEGKKWEGHLKLHRAVRDLLALSQWCDESFAEVRVLHSDAPLSAVSGKKIGEGWREVVVPASLQSTSVKADLQHLIRFEDLGPEGLLSWIRLRDEFARALDPVISSLRLREGTPHTLLAHTGPGLEALGYLLMCRDGVKKENAARTPFRERLKRILRDLGECLPFDGEAWSKSAPGYYNSIKHVNREECAGIDILNAWRESILVARAWVAVELGVSKDELKQRLSIDPQRHPYQESPWFF